MKQNELIGFGGHPLACGTYGNPADPPLLLIPGASCDGEGWERLARNLAQNGRFVQLLDLRGHGESPRSPGGHYKLDEFVADLREVLRNFDSRPSIVSSTLAAWISLLAIAEGEPDLASALVLLEPGPVADRGSLKVRAATTIELMELGQISQFDKTILNQVNAQEILDRAVQSAGRVRIPVLLARGEHSEFTCTLDLEWLAGALPDCQITDVPDAAQLNLEKVPDALADILLEFVDRRAPRIPLEYTESSDARSLRDAMGCFATGVTIVTTRDRNGRPVGFTANSFTSVSLDPPLLLVCPSRASRSLEAFEMQSSFAVNVLHVGQQCGPACKRDPVSGVIGV